MNEILQSIFVMIVYFTFANPFKETPALSQHGKSS